MVNGESGVQARIAAIAFGSVRVSGHGGDDPEQPWLLLEVRPPTKEKGCGWISAFR